MFMKSYFNVWKTLTVACSSGKKDEPGKKKMSTVRKDTLLKILDNIRRASIASEDDEGNWLDQMCDLDSLTFETLTFLPVDLRIVT